MKSNKIPKWKRRRRSRFFQLSCGGSVEIPFTPRTIPHYRCVISINGDRTYCVSDFSGLEAFKIAKLKYRDKQKLKAEFVARRLARSQRGIDW